MTVTEELILQTLRKQGRKAGIGVMELDYWSHKYKGQWAIIERRLDTDRAEYDIILSGLTFSQAKMLYYKCGIPDMFDRIREIENVKNYKII